MLLTVTSCLQNNKNEQTTPQDITESTTPVITTKEIELKPAPETPILTGVLDKSSDLILELIAHLQQPRGYINEAFNSSFASKIDAIKSGVRPIHVAFNPNNFYFVCGYFNLVDEHREIMYCCCDEYTWIGYESEAEIQEYLNDMKCIVVFQVNKALTVTELLDAETTTLNMEHFQVYKPTFESGVNIRPAVEIDKAFIYLDKADRATIYYSPDVPSNSIGGRPNNTIPCICIEEEYYISMQLYKIDTNGNFSLIGGLSNDYFIDEFGAYYDVIVSVMDIKKHNVIDNNGRTVIHGLISLENFIYDIVGWASNNKNLIKGRSNYYEIQKIYCVNYDFYSYCKFLNR